MGLSRWEKGKGKWLTKAKPEIWFWKKYTPWFQRKIQERLEERALTKTSKWNYASKCESTACTSHNPSWWFGNGRHHCRKCGKSICDSCAQNKRHFREYVLARGKSAGKGHLVSERVCPACYKSRRRRCLLRLAQP